MLMQNTSTNTIRIPSNMTEGWRGKSDATVAIAPGGVVNIANGFACRQRVAHSGSNAQVIPSAAERLSGHALKPYGQAATEIYKLFADELPEVIAAQAAYRTSSLGVAASVDAKAEAARREAMEIGFRTMAAQGRLRSEEGPAMQPPCFARRTCRRTRRPVWVVVVAMASTTRSASLFDRGLRSTFRAGRRCMCPRVFNRRPAQLFTMTTTALKRTTITSVPVEVDGTLAERLRCVVDALGGRGLPLPVIITALLVEAAAQLEAKRTAQEVLDASDS